ncbi:hypothetical protein KBC04_03940 [Candidatus Babeliales bacterium]|nr:hypothetical protein [Candidatus Babeliales bacterium]MBP9843353.1 hypothetical protein [Candidatus Babeliales bacterium]
MKSTTRLYLSLGLLLSTQLISSTNENINHVKTTSSHAQIDGCFQNTDQENAPELQEPENELSIEEQIDQELYEVFAQFFDEHDKSSFSHIVAKIVSLLKIKKTTLHGTEFVKCDEMIKLLERNKTNYSFPVWARILINPDLLNLMSENTRSYIHSVSNHVKIRSLISKLRNH